MTMEFRGLDVRQTGGQQVLDLLVQGGIVGNRGRFRRKGGGLFKHARAGCYKGTGNFKVMLLMASLRGLSSFKSSGNEYYQKKRKKRKPILCIANNNNNNGAPAIFGVYSTIQRNLWLTNVHYFFRVGSKL